VAFTITVLPKPVPSQTVVVLAGDSFAVAGHSAHPSVGSRAELAWLVAVACRRGWVAARGGWGRCRRGDYMLVAAMVMFAVAARSGGTGCEGRSNS
jgi:hypothetical protein